MKKKIIKTQQEQPEIKQEAEIPAQELNSAPGQETPQAKDTPAPGEKEKKKGSKRLKAKPAVTEAPEPVPTEEKPAEADEKPDLTAEKSPKKGSAKLVVAIVLSVLVLFFALYSFGGYKVTESPLILPNVYANGVDVGGLTVEQAQLRLAEAGFDESAEGRLRVKVPAGVVFYLDYSEAGAKLDSAAAAKIAYSHGHSGGWYANIGAYIANIFAPVDIIYFDKTLNYEYISSAIDAAAEEFAAATADEGYSLDLDKGYLTLMKGAGQLQVDKDALYRRIVDALLAGKESVSYQLSEEGLKAPDFEAIAKEINVEPADASFDENFEIRPSVTGVHLDAGEARKLWDGAETARPMFIPVTVTEPEISTEQLSDMLFRDLLGTQTTTFKWSSDNRINNIKLVSDKLNGMIMLPGDVFSFNGYIGQRTPEAGFKPAGAYMNGLVVEEVGGGICQVSSTLYCAVLLGQLEIVERTCHFFMVDYLPPGLDATVSWPDTDFKFKNSRDYPIKLRSICDVENKSITIEVWGTDVDGSYVELEYGVGPWFDDEYPEVEIGKTAACYRVIYDKDGNRIATIPESFSAYNYHPGEIKWPEPEEEEPEEGEGGTETPGDGTEPPGGTEPPPGGTEPPGGGGDNSGSGMEDEDGNINFG